MSNKKQSTVLRSLHELGAALRGPSIEPYKTFATPLVGSHKGRLGMLLEIRPGHGAKKYKMGFFREKWANIRHAPANNLDVEILAYNKSDLKFED